MATVVGKQGTVAIGLSDSLATVAARTHIIQGEQQAFNRFNPKARFIGRRGRPSASGMSFQPTAMSDLNELPIGGALDLNDVLLPLLTGVSRTPTITDPSGATSAKLWTWDPAARAFPAISYLTAEWREQDTDVAANQIAYLASKGFCTQFSLTASGIAMAMINASYQLGQQSSLAAQTAGLTSDSPVTVPVKAVQMGIYDTWAAMVAGDPGATRTIDYNISYNTGWNILTHRDGVLDYTVVAPSMRSMQISATVYVETDAAALERTEQAQRQSNGTRFVKMRFQSLSDIEAGFPYYLDVGMACQHDDNSITSRGNVSAEDFGTMQFMFSTFDDITASKNVYFALQTSKAALSDYP